MDIKGLLGAGWRKASALFEPKPVEWKDFAQALEEPDAWLSGHFVTHFQNFAAMPEHQVHLAPMSAHSHEGYHAFVEVRSNGTVDVMVRPDGFEVTEWQSKPDGSVYRGPGFRHLQQGTSNAVGVVVEKCFRDLDRNIHFSGALSLARASYAKDAAIFARDPATLDCLAYKN